MRGIRSGSIASLVVVLAACCGGTGASWTPAQSPLAAEPHIRVLLFEGRVVARQMPPWHIDRSIGDYVADPSQNYNDLST